MKRALLAGAMLLAASRAEASSITLPVNRLILDLPSSDWQVWSGDGDRNLDILRDSNQGSLAIGWADGDCARFFSAQAANVNGVLQPMTASFAPDGWEVRSYGGGAAFLACHAVGGRAWAAQWWALPSAPYNDQSSWSSHLGELLGALDKARRASSDAEAGNLLMMPGGLTAQVPLAFRFHDVKDRKTIRFIDADRVTVDISPITGSCHDTLANDFSGATEETSEVFDAIRWNMGGDDYYCSDAASLLVSSASNPAATALLMDSLIGEKSDPNLGSKDTLPGSGLQAGVPSGWNVAAAGKSTTITAKDGTLTITKVNRCALTGVTYDPSWIPSGWAAKLDGSTVHLCSEGARAEVDVPRAMVEGRPRHAVDAVVESLDVESEGGGGGGGHGHHGFIPAPLEIGFETIGGSATLSRGYGVRAGLELWTGGGAFSVRGEAGWDSQSKLSYDVRGTAGLHFGKHVAQARVYGAVGYDQIGSGADAKLTGEAYFGPGFAYGVWARDGTAYLSAEYLLRVHPSDSDPAAPLGPDTPKHEWRVRGQFFINEHHKVWSGMSLEYRAVPANMFMWGVFIRL